MPRKPQTDYPGAWHHAINRGAEHCAIFENRSDYRYFLSQLAKSAQRKEIEVHAYCLMGTHYHLLLRSVSGELPAVMRRIENRYVRRFNMLRERQGSLFDGRCTSRLVTSEVYRRILLRYIHFNPVKACVVAHPKDYRYSSAWLLAQPRAPKWLSNYWLDAERRSVEDSNRLANSRGRRVD